MSEYHSALSSKLRMRLSLLKRPSRRLTLVPRERVPQRIAEQVEDAPQPPEETVEAVDVGPA